LNIVVDFEKTVNAFLREGRRRLRFWGLLVVDEDILVIFVQPVNPHGRSVGEEGAVLFYSEGDGQGRRFPLPAIEDKGRVVTGSQAQPAEVGACEQHLKYTSSCWGADSTRDAFQ
jgi:hypothetical protein